jgi:hypothetical protein
MSELPIKSLNDDESLEFYTNLYLEELIKNVSIYILSKNLTKNFYNFSDFFFKHKIDNDQVKIQLKSKIIQLLKDKEYNLAYVFNNTGLIITKSKEDLSNSVWKSNLDYKEL